ncbi:MAG: chorismate synthase [Fervidicoccaceae archaeon]
MLGERFRITLFGESHGPCVGVVIEGCPPGLEINEEIIAKELSKRAPGGCLVSSRAEPDRPEILSGVFRGRTTGAPITIIVRNVDVDSEFYEEVKYKPRPGHADYVAWARYRGFNDYRGGGIFSGRITVGLVAAGAVAKVLLKLHGIRVVSYVKRIGHVDASIDPSMDIESLERSALESPVRCPDPRASTAMVELLREVQREGDSVGGIVETIATGLPLGLGEPPMDTLDGDLAKILFAIPAVKGVEFGLGFELAKMRGSEANDEWTVLEDGGEKRVALASNKCGGILGGLSTGSPLVFRVVFKPTPTIRRPQRTVDLRTLQSTIIEGRGRHDPCVAVRGAAAVEAATSIILADHLLRWNSWRGASF